MLRLQLITQEAYIFSCIFSCVFSYVNSLLFLYTDSLFYLIFGLCLGSSRLSILSIFCEGLMLRLQLITQEAYIFSCIFSYVILFYF